MNSENTIEISKQIRENEKVLKLLENSKIEQI